MILFFSIARVETEAVSDLDQAPFTLISHERWRATTLPSGESAGQQVTIVGSAAYKSARANMLYQEFDAAVNAFLDTDPYQPVFETVSGNPLEWIVRLNVRLTPPHEFSVIIGDMLHNLRSALDHIIWLLAESHSGQAPEMSEFPIFLYKDKYHNVDKKGQPVRGSGPFKIRGVNDQAQVMIESMQPYNTTDRPELHPLWVLHELSNTDKHRELALLYTYVERPEFSVRDSDNAEIESVDYEQGPFGDGDIMARIKLRLLDQSKSGRAYLITPVKPRIAFADGPSRGLSALETLGEMGMFVSKALDQLSTLFEPAAQPSC